MGRHALRVHGLRRYLYRLTYTWLVAVAHVLLGKALLRCAVAVVALALLAGTTSRPAPRPQPPGHYGGSS